jgi:hypothetical protein
MAEVLRRGSTRPEHVLDLLQVSGPLTGNPVVPRSWQTTQSATARRAAPHQSGNAPLDRALLRAEDNSRPQHPRQATPRAPASAEDEAHVTPLPGPSSRHRPPDHRAIRDATPLSPSPADQRAPAATRAPHAGEPDLLPSPSVRVSPQRNSRQTPAWVNHLEHFL